MLHQVQKSFAISYRCQKAIRRACVGLDCHQSGVCTDHLRDISGRCNTAHYIHCNPARFRNERSSYRNPNPPSDTVQPDCSLPLLNSASLADGKQTMHVSNVIRLRTDAAAVPHVQHTSTLWPSQRLQQLGVLTWSRAQCSRHCTVTRRAAETDGSRSTEAPWDFGFQCNERLLAWDGSAQAQLIRIWLAQELHLTTDQVRGGILRQRNEQQLTAHHRCAGPAQMCLHLPPLVPPPSHLPDVCAICMTGTTVISLRTTLRTPPVVFNQGSLCGVMQVQQKLEELGTLLPDMVGKLDKAQAKVLYQLVQDPAWTAQWLLGLRAALPRSNVSALVTAHPQLMLTFTVRPLATGCA